MKIAKLTKDPAGRYDIAELPAKINEIIDVLNKSFITNDPDTVYGECVPLTNLSCDRLTHFVNEQVSTLQLNGLGDVVKGVSLYDGIKCPNCGSTHFMIGQSSMTCVYYPPIIKDGININPDRNKTTTSYTCCECGKDWTETT
jgi:DNA-directed RNA polymerase subunit RPC12/RpoP